MYESLQIPYEMVVNIEIIIQKGANDAAVACVCMTYDVYMSIRETDPCDCSSELFT